MNDILRTREHAALNIAGREFEVATVETEESISSLFAVEITCRGVAPTESVDALVGAASHLVLADARGYRRLVTGMVGEAELMVHDDAATLHLVLVPEAHRLTLGRNCRVFHDATVADIVSRVLDEGRVPHRWELSDAYPVRTYTAQYREDDWSFVSRLLEEEGVHSWFDHAGDATVLVLSDDSTAASALVGAPFVTFALERGMLGDEEHVHELAAGCRATAERFTVGSFDEQRPNLPLLASAGDGDLEVYDAPGGGPIDPAVCRRRATIRREHALAHRRVARGAGVCPRLVPGRSVVIAGHPSLDGEWLVLSVRHQVVQRQRFASVSAPLGHRCSFELIEKARRYRPAEKTPQAKQPGIQTGRVVGPPGEEIHTDARGRVRVQHHWDREGGFDDRAGKWMRSAQRGVGMSMLYPRVGWNVVTYNLEGGADAPTVLSRLHDAEHPPPYELPANKTRTVFKTATSPADGSFNEIQLEDLAGAEEMFLNASRDMNYIVRNDAGLSVEHDQTRIVVGNQELEVSGEVVEQVGGSQTVSIEADEKLNVGMGRAKDVHGAETTTVGASREVKTAGAFNVNVNDARTLTVNGNVEEHCDGNLGLLAGLATHTISGSLSRSSGGDQSESAAELIQTITQNKIAMADGSITLGVGKTLTETITGSLAIGVDGTYVDGAEEVTKWTVGGAFDASAPEIHIEAKDRIEIVVGSSSLVLDKQSITLNTPSYALSAASQLVAKAAMITHN